MKKGRFLLGCVLFLLASKLFAADPISWSINNPFPQTVFVAGGTYTTVYTFTNQLPFTLVHPLVITKTTNAATEITFQDHCTGKKLASRATCTVSIELVPRTVGEKNIQLTITGYDNNVVPLPILSTMATNDTGVNIIASTVTALPAFMTVNTSASFKFQFSNQGTASATGVTINTNVINFSTTCTAQLAAGATCTVTGIFIPTSTSPTTQTVTATLSFNQGSPVNISSSTTVNAATGITAQLIQALPGITVPNTPYTVTFGFTNHEAVAVDVNQNNTFPPEFTEDLVNSTCPDGGAALVSGASCIITGTFNSAVSGNFTVTAQLTPTASPPPPATISTSTDTSSSTTGRTVTFVNNCNFPVWFSLSGANRQNAGVDIPCTSDINCPSGSRCNPSAGTAGLCFWENYAPANNIFQLNNSTPTSVFIPNSSDPNIEWSGAFSASAVCNGTSSCLLADCQNKGGSAACSPGVGFGQPATQAEITMLKNGVDTYDIEVINGFHIPIQIQPSGGVVNQYNCGTPGQTIATADFGACNWNTAVVPNNLYYWVGEGSGTSCSLSSSGQGCSVSGELCGLNIGINQVCGNFLGFWTANQACAVNVTNAQPFFNCNDVLVSPFPPNTYHLSDLYGCKTPDASQPTLNSCYKNGATTACCGCANWQTLSIIPQIILPAATESCLNSDQQWETSVQNSIVWMKQACPTTYTYPFDDKSSTFTCSNGTPNTLNYTITFCAGGFTGAPNGITDGRS